MVVDRYARKLTLTRIAGVRIDISTRVPAHPITMIQGGGESHEGNDEAG